MGKWVENYQQRKTPPLEEIQKAYWTAKDAARYLGVHFTTVYSWIKPSKKRPAKIIGTPPPYRRFGENCIRFPIEEFKAWAAKLDEGEKPKCTS